MQSSLSWLVSRRVSVFYVAKAVASLRADDFK